MSKWKFQYRKMTAVLISAAWVIILAGCAAGATERDPAANITQQARSVQAVDDGIAVIDAAGRELKFQKPPERVVSMIPADLEIVHQLGGTVVGGAAGVMDDLGDIGLGKVTEAGDAHNLDFEKILSLQPDLVIGHADLNAKDAGTFESLGMKLLLSKADSYEDIIATIAMYGGLLGREEQASELVTALEERTAAIAPLQEEVRALIVFGSTESFMAALPGSISGSLLKRLGGINIAEGLPGIERYPEYAQLSMERVVSGNPDIIFFIAHGEAEAVKSKFEEEMKSNDAWRNVNAIKQNRLVILPQELFSTNPGLRVAEALEYMHASLSSVSGGNR